VLLLIIMGGCGWLLVDPTGSSGGAPRPASNLATPVLSPRRVAALLVATSAELRLQDTLATVSLPSKSACVTVRLSGQDLYQAGSPAGLIPASNLKLVTAAAVLNRVDPKERFVTEARAAAAPSAGVIDGPLYLVGGGDPLLRTADYIPTMRYTPQLWTHFEDLASAVVAAGVHEIRGGIVGDDSRYDQQRFIPTWKTSYRTDGEVGPLSALSVNDGFASYTTRKVSAPDPASQAAGVLAGLLRARGVIVGATASPGQTPAASVVVASLSSPPMSDIVDEMLDVSDNNAAELLTKELGKRFGGAPTTAAGVVVIRDALSRMGLPVAEFTAVDGSGLDRSDRAACGLIAGLLDQQGTTGDFARGLSVGAKTGTLVHRFQAPALAGRILAKTGTLDGVSTLSGFVLGPVPGPPLVFSIMLNGLPREAIGLTFEDRFAGLLAAYPQSLPAASLDPAGTG
jgi:D-alanyl-D-alanine carboxypeptidase/D-alanyl-D-alanine-endopeptidase (penicillin-binding protein 4)